MFVYAYLHTEILIFELIYTQMLYVPISYLHIMHHLWLESASFFVPSTSSCSLSSWLTSSCAYHLITVTTLALTIYHSLGHLFHTYPFLCFRLDCFHGSWTWTRFSGHWSLFVLVSSFDIFCFWLYVF